MEFETKCAILADLWLNYRDIEGLQDFIEYNDIGLPLAYLVHSELVTANDQSLLYVDETYNLLAESLGLDLDEEFSTLSEMLDNSEEE